MTGRYFQYIPQIGEMDCGVAALAMIVTYYGPCPTFSELRELTQTNNAGTTAYGLLTAAKKLHFDTLAIQAERTLFTQVDLPLPFIVHTTQGSGDYHYMVVYGRTNGLLYLADPDGAIGTITMSITDFDSIWTGVALFIMPQKANQ